jgi:hypothetical protein
MLNQDNSNSLFHLASSFINYTDRNLFLTGRAGTGKTTFLRHIVGTTNKKAVVVAPTGVAAINAGGVTIHSFFQLPLGPYVPQPINSWSLSSNPAYDKTFLLKNIRINSNKRKLIEELDLLIIDEISMVRADLLDAIDVVLRYFRKNQRLPFGGVQVLMIGDLFQLPPVAVNEEWDLLSSFYQSPFFFDAHVIKQSPPLCIELQKIYRQSEQTFIDLLNRIRNNKINHEDLTWLDSFYKPGFTPSKTDNFITLTSHNHISDKINERELNNLPGKKHSYEAFVDGVFYERSFPADEVLHLKVGAQIMFIKNDKGENRKYYNGKIGVVKEIDDDYIAIGFPNEDQELILEREEWKNVRYKYNEEEKQVEEEVLGTFAQFPIRLAWAITIHKSQGLTFEKAIIDAGASFTAGQVYVALSRLTSLDGLVLRSKIGRDCIQCDADVLHFMSNLHFEEELKDILRDEQKLYVYNNLTKSFSWSKLNGNIQNFVEDYREKKSPLSEEAIKNGCLWLEKAIDQQQVADRFVVELNKILAQKEAGYPKLFERVQASHQYFSKRIKEELFDTMDHHRMSISAKSKTKKYLNRIRSLQILVKDQEAQIKSACTLAEGLYMGIDSLSLMQKYEKIKNAPVHIPLPEVKKAVKGETRLISLQMFKEGISIEGIAKKRELAVGTIESHLAQYIKTGELSVYDILSEEKVKMILPLVEQSEDYASAPIKSRLGDDFSYGEIRAVINHHLWKQQQEVGQ